MPSAIQWTVIKERDELLSYLEQWTILSSQNDDYFFTSPSWLLPWLDTFWQDNWELNVIIGSIANKCCVFAPLYIQRNKARIVTVSEMFPIGQGELELEEVASEYQDILIDKAHNTQKTQRELAKILDEQQFDVIKWRAISASSNILNTMSFSRKKSIKHSGIRYVLDKKIKPLKKESKNTRYKLNKSRRALDSLRATFFWCTDIDKHYYWSKLIELHTKRWNESGKSGACSGKKFRQFHHKCLTNDMSALSVLLVDGKAIAINYYLTNNDTLFFYQSGWDTTFANISPGFSLHKWSIENSTLTKYDFMMGNTENSYKKNYQCNQESNMYNIEHVKNPFKLLICKLIRYFF